MDRVCQVTGQDQRGASRIVGDDEHHGPVLRLAAQLTDVRRGQETGEAVELSDPGGQVLPFLHRRAPGQSQVGRRPSGLLSLLGLVHQGQITHRTHFRSWPSMPASCR